LALSYLLVGKGGATYVGAVSGLLISVVKPLFFPLDIIFAVFFGLLVDGLAAVSRAKSGGGDASTVRHVGVRMVSTGLGGFVAYYVTAVATNLVTNSLVMDLTTIVFGVPTAAAGGLVASRDWHQ